MTADPPPLPPPSSDHPGVVVLGDPAEPEYEAEPARRPVAGLQRLAVILLALAAAALVGGTFQPYDIFSANSGDPSLAQSVKTSAWAVTTSQSSGGFNVPDNSHPPYFGIPFCLVALALLVAIGLLVSASAAAKAFALAAAAAAVATMAMLATFESSFLSSYDEEALKLYGVAGSTGSGFWVLLAGTVLAVIGTVFAYLPFRTPAGDDSEGVDSIADMDTPPMGFPAPEIRE